MTEQEYPVGVKLGIDVGTVRVGVASCDPSGLIATPVGTFQRDARKQSDIRQVVNEAVERGAVEIFVGLPRTMRGEEGPSALMAREYAAALANMLASRGVDVPLRLIDERLTTVSAHRSLREAGLNTREHRRVVDQAAAVGILQHAIDTQRSQGKDVGVPVPAQRAGDDEPAPATTRQSTNGEDTER